MADKKIPYDRNHHLEQLMYVIVVVNDGQANAISEFFVDNEAYLTFITKGHGTAEKGLYEILGVANFRKDVVISIVKQTRWPVIKRQLRDRFSISNLSRGIAFCGKIDAVMCVSVYKMLANIRYIEKPVKKFQMKRSKKEEEKK